MGKGSQLRPTAVSEAEAQRRWEQTFKRQAQPDTGSAENPLTKHRGDTNGQGTNQ